MFRRRTKPCACWSVWRCTWQVQTDAARLHVFRSAVGQAQESCTSLPGNGSRMRLSKTVVLLWLHFVVHTFPDCCHFTYAQNNTATFASVMHSGNGRLQCFLWKQMAAQWYPRISSVTFVIACQCCSAIFIGSEHKLSPRYTVSSLSPTVCTFSLQGRLRSVSCCAECGPHAVDCATGCNLIRAVCDFNRPYRLVLAIVPSCASELP